MTIDALKPTVCAYSSLFTLTNIQNAYKIYKGVVYANESDNPLRNYAKDYCDNLESTVGAKLAVINKLKTFNTNTTEFDDGCLDTLSKADNKWFDPLIPSELITYGDICQGFRELFI